MWSNYFKIAFRNLWGKRAYSLINITGLAVGMACCFLIFLYVHFELSYDRFHQKAHQIYRVVGDLTSSAETLHWYVTPGPLGRSINDEFPQVQEVTRFINGSVLIQKGNIRHPQEGVGGGAVYDLDQPGREYLGGVFTVEFYAASAAWV